MTDTKVDLNEEDYEINFIEHYGVKGMKWGVRRSQEQLDRAAGRKVSSSSSSGGSSSTSTSTSGGSSSSNKSGSSSKSSGKTQKKKSKPKKAKRQSDSAKEKEYRREVRTENKALAKLAKRPVSDLTTKELQDVTKRLQLERQHAQLTGSEKATAKSVGTKVLKGAKVMNDVASTGTNMYNNGKKIMSIAEELNKRR